MAQGPFTRIVVRRPDGKVEVIGRHGTHAPGDVARALTKAGAGEALSVRHEMHSGGTQQTMAIHPMRK
jgi:hypothetical protein